MCKRRKLSLRRSSPIRRGSNPGDRLLRRRQSWSPTISRCMEMVRISGTMQLTKWFARSPWSGIQRFAGGSTSSVLGALCRYHQGI